MKESKLLSVIVPVYNREKYLEECLETIINQEYKNIEILIIDNGSTDGSRAIINQYEAKDSRIKSYFTENLGVSAARNLGIAESKGEYIAFVDSDDWIDIKMYLEMINKIEDNNCDVALCSFVREVTQQVKWNEILPFKSEEKLEGEDLYKRLVLNLVSFEDERKESIMGAIWRCVFKAELIKKNEIFFDVQMHFAEDLIFCLDAFLKSNSVFILNKAFYHYRFTESSITSQYKSDHFSRQLLIYEKVKEAFTNYNGEEFNERLNIMMLRYIINGITHICNIDGNFYTKYKLTRELLNNKYCREFRHGYKIKSIKYKILQYNLPLITLVQISYVNKKSKKKAKEME